MNGFKVEPDGLKADYAQAVDALSGSVSTFRSILPKDDGSQSGHPGEEGRWTESLISEFLRERLPADLEVSTGFVLDVEQKRRSYQVDILVHDASLHAPLFRYGDAVIVAPEAVVAAISVKYRLRSAEKLTSELESLSDIGAICGSGSGVPPYLAVVGYVMDHQKKADLDSSGLSSFDAYCTSVSRTFKKYYTELSKRPEKLSANEIVESVIALDGFILHAGSFDKARARSSSSKNGGKSVSVVWRAPTGKSRHALGEELVEGVVRRFRARRNLTVRRRLKHKAAGAKPVASLPIACWNRPLGKKSRSKSDLSKGA